MTDSSQNYDLEESASIILESNNTPIPLTQQQSQQISTSSPVVPLLNLEKTSKPNFDNQSRSTSNKKCQVSKTRKPNLVQYSRLKRQQKESLKHVISYRTIRQNPNNLVKNVGSSRKPQNNRLTPKNSLRVQKQPRSNYTTQHYFSPKLTPKRRRSSSSTRRQKDSLNQHLTPMRKRSSSGFNIEKVPNLKSEVIKLLKIMSKHYKSCGGLRDDLSRVNGSQLLTDYMAFQSK